MGTQKRLDEQLARAQSVLQHHLGSSLIAIHLFGSAVESGLQTMSDVDLLVTATHPLTSATRESLGVDLLEVSAWPPTSTLRPLEVTIVVENAINPWTYPPQREFQFGEWLREELLSGQVQNAVLDHDLAVILTQVRQRNVVLLGPAASELFEPVPTCDFHRALLDTVKLWNEPEDWRGDERNVVLALARIWFSLSTGRIASKDLAANWALERLPEPCQPILATARAVYLGEAIDNLATRSDELYEYIRTAKSAIERLTSEHCEFRAN